MAMISFGEHSSEEEQYLYRSVQENEQLIKQLERQVIALKKELILQRELSNELENLRQGTVKAILNADNIDERYLVIGRKSFSRRELAVAIRDQTPEGNGILKSMLLLAVDLVLRQKREI